MHFMLVSFPSPMVVRRHSITAPWPDVTSFRQYLLIWWVRKSILSYSTQTLNKCLYFYYWSFGNSKVLQVVIDLIRNYSNENMWNFLLLLRFIWLSRHVVTVKSTGSQTRIKLVQINIIKGHCCTWYLLKLYRAQQLTKQNIFTTTGGSFEITVHYINNYTLTINGK